MITRAAPRLARLARLACGVAALLSLGAPAPAGEAQVARCSPTAVEAVFGVVDPAGDDRSHRGGGFDAVPGCGRLEVPQPFPLALFGLGLVAMALARRRPVRVEQGLYADLQLLPNAR